MKTGFSIFAVTLISILAVHCALAKTDYFVTLDPNTGAITRSTSFPQLQTVYSTAYDQTLNRFFFVGYGSDGYYRLYTLLAAGGGIVSSPVVPSAYPGIVPITNLQYDNIANKLYGFTQSGTHVFLVSINPGSGSYAAVDSFPSIAPVYLSMFDHHAGDCVFITGSIPQSLPYQLHIYDPAGRKHISDFYLTNQNGCSPSFIQCLQFDDSTKQLNGLAYISGVYFYGSIPRDSSAFIRKINLTYSALNLYSIVSTSYDQSTHKLFIFGFGSNGYYPQDSTFFQMITIDALHDSVLGSAILPANAGQDTDVCSLEYANGARQLKGIMYVPAPSRITEPVLPDKDLSVFPNPTKNTSTFQLDGSYSTVTALITNSLGQILRKDIFHGASEINIQRGALPDGSYFVQLTGDGKLLGTVKLGVE